MLSIRLTRVGKTKEPSFRLIVLDKRKDPWGDYLENLGTVNRRGKEKKYALNADRIKYWISKGAQPSAPVWNMLVDQKIVEGKKKKAHNSARKAAVAAPAEAAKPAEAKKEEAKT
jgi:small subunit ribosomal protein S16